MRVGFLVRRIFTCRFKDQFGFSVSVASGLALEARMEWRFVRVLRIGGNLITQIHFELLIVQSTPFVFGAGRYSTDVEHLPGEPTTRASL